MKRVNNGFSFIELIVVIAIITIIAVFSIPILSRILTVYKTRAAAETLAQQFYQARQAAINFGRRPSPPGPIAVWLYPATATRGVSIWVDRNNSQIDPTNPSTPVPDLEKIFLPQGILVGNTTGATPQCTLSASAPLKLCEYNSRGELASSFTSAVPQCLQNPAGNTNNFTIDLHVESAMGARVMTHYLVGVSLRGSVSVVGR